MTNKFKLIALVAIFCVGFFLRFYKLGIIPNGLYQDETAIGYNAYSILKTGRDEYGKPFPVYFKSFGDYKLPVYIYATIPSIALFGLTPFAVRLPSAFFGFLTLLMLYLLTLTVSKNKQLSLIAMALLAINPWHIHYSRAAFEVTISLFLFLLGTWSIHKAYENRRGFFFFGTICFILALYSYNLTRLLSPILFFIVNWICSQNSKKPNSTECWLTGITALILLMPFAKTIVSPEGIASSAGTLIFTSPSVQAPLQELRSYMLVLPSTITKIFFNTIALTSWQFITNVASYFSVPFFFLSGSMHGNHGIGTVGQFYLFELPLIILGVIAFMKEKSAFARLLFLWFLATVCVASLTRETPHATRSFFLLFPLILYSAKGLIWLVSYSLKRNNPIQRFMLGIVFLSFFVYNMIFYLTSYFIRFPFAYAKSWRSADAQLAYYIRNNESKYDRIIIDSNSGFIYTSLLFYTAYPPVDFQKTSRRLPDNLEGFSTVSSFGKYEIWDIAQKDTYTNRTLVIANGDNKSNPPLETFYYPRRPVVLALKGEIIRYPVDEIAYVVFAVGNDASRSETQ